VADDLRQYLSEQQTRVERHLREILLLAGDCPTSLLEAMRYSLLAPGKRLRPLLVILAAEASGDASGALAAACAVEMVHTYSLIHDDLPAMDDDDLRRGQPTCHKQFGEALAILAGDALLTLAFQVLAECYPPCTATGCTLELARGAGPAGMVGGQVEDLAWEQRLPGVHSAPSLTLRVSEIPAPTRRVSEGGSPQLQDLEKIHACKTGALFRACLRIGCWTALGENPAGIDKGVLECLDGYGRCFGQLFQITDDLLDVEGNAAETGKRVQKDAARGKLTYPGFLGPDESRRRADELVSQAQGQLRPLNKAGQRLAELVRLIRDRDR
jgi:geranylgeranyl diphosphate synthase type II